MTLTYRRWPLVVATSLLVGCDHATKEAARDALLSGRVVSLVHGWLELRYTENFDTAFSLTRGWSGNEKAIVLTLVSVAMTVGLLLLAWRRRHEARPLETIALAITVAGAAGNTLDRVRRGYVVDFIYLHHWPIFNVADVLIVVGAALLALNN